MQRLLVVAYRQRKAEQQTCRAASLLQANRLHLDDGLHFGANTLSGGATPSMPAIGGGGGPAPPGGGGGGGGPAPLA